MERQPFTFGTQSRNPELGFRIQGSGRRFQDSGFRLATKVTTKVFQGPNFKFHVSSFKPTLAALAMLACASASAEVAADAAPAPADAAAIAAPAPAEEVPARRNPFWPVGYTPKTTATQGVAEAKAPALSDEEIRLQTPVEPAEWDAAQAALPKPGGMFIGANPETRERVDKMILMGQTLQAGQAFTTTNNAIAFTWRVDYISVQSRDYGLSQVSAERVPGGQSARKKE